MKAVVHQEPYEVMVEEMPDPKAETPNDAVVRMTTNIRGPGLHIYTSQIVSHEIPLCSAYDKLAKRIDGYTKAPIKPGMAA